MWLGRVDIGDIGLECVGDCWLGIVACVALVVAAGVIGEVARRDGDYGRCLDWATHHDEAALLVAAGAAAYGDYEEGPD